MRRNWLIIICILSLSSAVAQPFANDWIDYSPNRYYVKFKVTEDGLYRIDQNALDFATELVGQDLSTIDPRSIQIFGRGAEQFIHVEGENDGSFDPGDYIEFYAQHNDGWADESFYPNADQHTNPFYSLYNDTATYFLTWIPDGSFSSARYQTIPFSTSSNPLSYVWAERLKFYTNVYQKGEDLGSGKPKTTYDGGKGWMSSNFGYNDQSIRNLSAISFNTDEFYTGAGSPDASLEVALAGFNLGAGGNEAHHVQIQLNTGGSFNALEDLTYGSYEYIRYTLSISNDLPNQTSVRLTTSQSISTITTFSDYSTCAYVKLSYPHTLNLSGLNSFEFEAPAANGNRFFNATNFNAQPAEAIYDLVTHQRLVTNQSGGAIQALIPAGQRRKMILASTAAINTISGTDFEVVGANGQFIDPSQWEQDNAYLMVSHRSLWTEAERYRNYRNGQFNTVLIDIEWLYDQFAYGIRKHPLAIRNFIDLALAEWNTAPQHLFIIGKSIEEQRTRRNSELSARSLVPCMGFPASDNLITAGLGSSPAHVAAIPTGRIAARNNEEISLYLNKVRSFENSQNTQINPYTIGKRKWQKNILHFAGGNNAQENQRFRGYLSGYQSFVEDSLFGGKVYLFSKTSGNVIEQLNTDSIRDLLAEGPAVMTFFGHASGNSFDLSVDDPSLWNNQGRYPFVIANSCFSGNIHLPVEIVSSVSEQYLFTPNEGAIAFVATPDLSYENYLNIYTVRLYEEFARNSYGESFSTQMRNTASQLPGDDRSATITLEMTLHGDPALQLYPHDKTEITVNDPVLGADLEFKPKNITNDIDSFSVVVHLTNLGRASNRVFNVTATRSFPNGAEPIIKTQAVNGIAYEQAVIFRFATDTENGIGENNISVEVDLPLSNIEEFIETENNRIANAQFFISSSDIFPVFPYNHAVVPNFDITLRANTGYPFLEEAGYLIEIDTIDLYNSPFKRSTTITQAGAVIEWNPDLSNLALADSTVFFWRVTPSSDLTKWREFSFQVVDEQTGWGQAHFFQLKNNAFDLMEADRSDRRLKFEEASRELLAQVVGNPAIAEFANSYYSLDGQGAPLGEYGIASIIPGFAVVVIDSVELRPWGTYGIGPDGNFINQDKRFGNNNDGNAHRRRVEYFFTFDTSDVQMAAMINMIENEVPDGHYLLFYTQRRGYFEDDAVWGDNELDFFEDLGADSIRYVPNINPYIFLVEKGRPETGQQVIGSTDREIIRLTSTLTSNFRFGQMTSPQIGPAMEWQQFIFDQFSLEGNSSEVKKAAFTEINTAGLEQPVDTLFQDGSLDLTTQEAIQYPYAKLDFHTEDNTSLTPSQLSSWHVLYEPAPDAAINPIKGQTYVQGDELIAGVDFNFGIAVENVSDYDFDAFRVHYWFIDPEGKVVDEKWLDYSSMTAGEVIFDSVSFETKQLNGRYFMYMEVNPMGEDWHREQFSFNNRAYLSFEINADRKNPILDVTFDGVHILNGDIVSPEPEIVMELKDENPYLLMEDTTSFDVYLTNPSGFERRIPFVSAGREVMYFEPATSQQNKARVTYRPADPLGDGDYQLTVMGKDASGNNSGADAYHIDFEVINRSTVTHVMNYPNPFTTSTRFVFTLTGATIPDVFTIQIMTVTGKVVREITKNELGNIRIGRNMTDYAWDGRDEYGDRLANGVYLYRVIMKIEGEQIERRASGADSYFTKEFGKMYLFR